MYTEYMLNSWGPAYMFYYYSALNFAGYFFVKLCMKETYGKTDREKKQLYIQDANVEDGDFK